MVNSRDVERQTLGRNREDVRQHNLSAVLQLLHQYGTMSRSQLTQITGLNRSTISDLVDELEELGLANETEAQAKEGVGRPSLMVSVSDSVVAFSVHPEIDSTMVAAVSLSGKVLLRERIVHRSQPAAPTAVAKAAEAIEKLRSQLPAGTNVVGVGVAVPGQVRVEDGVVRLAPHLNWVETPFARMLSQLVNLPVYIDNDASIGCLAERIFGAAREFNDVIYLFGGSGIGGGVVIGGQQLRGTAGYAGELGHVRISDSPVDDYSGFQGTLESQVRREDLLEALKLENVEDEELEVALLASKSAKVTKLVERQIDALAIAIANFVNIFNPQVIVLSGFLPALFKFDQDRLLSKFRDSALTASQERVIVRTAELGANILMIGAAELPFSQVIANPSGFELTLANKKQKR